MATPTFILLKEGNTFNVPIQTYYIESSGELANIPSEAPAGTIAECNASSGFSIYMKNTSGNWNAL